MESDKSSVELICANCQGDGMLACKSCRLVLYCGPNCQQAHWNVHKIDCRSKLNKDSWQPQWVRQSRAPTYHDKSKPSHSRSAIGELKYLWGNMPAIDVLQLASNEGEAYRQDLRILFAASGDLRIVIETIGAIPDTYQNCISSIVNDKDHSVVAHNILILLVALIAEDSIQAAECMLHIWYSALIRKEDMDFLASHIRPLIADVNLKIKYKAPEALLEKVWTFGNCTIRIVLSKEGWEALLSLCSPIEDLSPERATQARTAITLIAESHDCKERRMVLQRPAHRVCARKFLEYGILLPFGQSTDAFNVPNPTLFQHDKWLLPDASDPLDGWSFPDILSTNSGSATNDVNAKLFFHIRTRLSRFQQRLRSRKLEFQLFNLDALELPGHIQGAMGTFARIETSNISDRRYLGLHDTIATLCPFLQSVKDNHHATLITLFMTAVDEVSEDWLGRMDGITPDISRVLEWNRVTEYLPHFQLPGNTYDAHTVLAESSLPIVRDVDRIFDALMGPHGLRFADVEKDYGVVGNVEHTIVPKWPMRLKLKPNEPGAQEEFEMLRSCGNSRTERYVEWKRTK